MESGLCKARDIDFRRSKAQDVDHSRTARHELRISIPSVTMAWKSSEDEDRTASPAEFEPVRHVANT